MARPSGAVRTTPLSTISVTAMVESPKSVRKGEGLAAASPALPPHASAKNRVAPAPAPVLEFSKRNTNRQTHTIWLPNEVLTADYHKVIG